VETRERERKKRAGVVAFSSARRVFSEVPSFSPVRWGFRLSDSGWKFPSDIIDII